MDFSYLKFLIYCKKIMKNEAIITYDKLIPKFRLDNDDIENLVEDLSKDNYVRKLGQKSFMLTYKGRNAFSSAAIHWLAQFVLSGIALILSIIALING